jgi:hypothetical protein
MREIGLLVVKERYGVEERSSKSMKRTTSVCQTPKARGSFGIMPSALLILIARKSHIDGSTWIYKLPPMQQFAVCNLPGIVRCVWAPDKLYPSFLLTA